MCHRLQYFINFIIIYNQVFLTHIFVMLDFSLISSVIPDAVLIKFDSPDDER